MKVLFITHHLKGNDGWSRYARDLISGLVTEGVEPLCIVNEISPETNVPQKVGLLGPLAYLAHPVRSYLSARKVQRVIDDFSPDLIHIIVEPYGTMLPFLRTGRAKVVFTAHSTYAFFPILMSGWWRVLFSRYITRLMYRRVDKIICVSEYTKKHLVQHMSAAGMANLVEGKTDVLAGGVDVSRISVRTKKSLNGGSDTAVRKEILFVGAVKPRKGVKEAIDALAQVNLTTDFIFRIVGTYRDTDPYIILLREKIAEYGLAEKVVFTGVVSDQDLACLYDSADLFLMLSTNNGADFEGYGLVYIEANAHGVPAIGPNDSGVSDAILDGRTGYLVNQYDPASVARKIEDVLERATINSADCQAWARENTVEKKAIAMCEIYKRTIFI